MLNAHNSHLIIGSCARRVGRLTVFIAIWIYTCSLRLCVISTMCAVRKAIISLNFIVRYSTSGYGRTCVSSIMAGTGVLATGRKSSSCRSSSSTNRTNFRVLFCVLVLSRKQSTTLSVARSVVVRRTGSVAFLFLVATHQCDLHGGSAEKEEGSNDGNRECRSVETTCRTQVNSVDYVITTGPWRTTKTTSAGTSIANAQRSIDNACAFVRAVPRHDRNCDHGTAKTKVKDNGHEGKERDAAETAREERGTNQVQCCRP